MSIRLGVLLFQAAFTLYATAMVCYAAHFIHRRDFVGRVGSALLIAGLLLHTGSLIVRTVAAERPPFLNMYEYMLSLTWGAVGVYLVLERMMSTRVLGAFVVPAVIVLAFIGVRLPSEVNPTMPALKSAWRVPHIATAILAYASFTASFGMSLMYMVACRRKSGKGFWESRLPNRSQLDWTIYRTISFGFMMQTLLIVTGAVWAQVAWGRFWSWDPKETWALITWLVYAVYLHTRTAKGWRGEKSAIVALVGFAAVVFTLFGVTLLGGLHSYAR